MCSCVFFFNDTATTEIYTLSLHDALPISSLDPLGGEMVSRFLQSLIRKREHTFVIVEQRIEEFIPWVDRIVAMREGRIVEEGPPFDVLNDEARWERVRAAGVNVPQLF